jgi:hypothetical protein
MTIRHKQRLRGVISFYGFTGPKVKNDKGLNNKGTMQTLSCPRINIPPCRKQSR